MRARMPYIDRIWRVQSSLDLAEPLTASEAFERLEPLLQEQGTEYAMRDDRLAYQKTNPGAQDKLATFTAGELSVASEAGVTRLTYDVTSTALFLCFLAPLAFLAFGQFAEVINELEKPGLIAEKEQKEKEEAEKGDEPDKDIELHWIDQMLGASTPDKSDEEDKKEEEKGEEEEFEGNHSPTTAYVFAGIFFLIYLVGRVLEPYLLKRTFRAALSGSFQPSDPDYDAGTNTGSTGSPASGTATRLEFGT